MAYRPPDGVSDRVCRFRVVQVLGPDEHAQQMSRLHEMIVETRQAAEQAGFELSPVFNYPIDGSI